MPNCSQSLTVEKEQAMRSEEQLDVDEPVIQIFHLVQIADSVCDEIEERLCDEQICSVSKGRVGQCRLLNPEETTRHRSGLGTVFAAQRSRPPRCPSVMVGERCLTSKH
jgi:hypothetical protein